MEHALVLNASFEPLHVVHWQKAIQLLFQGKVEVLEEYDKEVRSVSIAIKVPAVLRLLRYIPLVQKKNFIRFSRANIFARDQFTCQYCGKKRIRQELTLDHVIPAVQGGEKDWTNIVTACIQCNQRKGGRTPAEANMHLIAKPKSPSEVSYWFPLITFRYRLHSPPETWKVYLSWQLKPSHNSG